MADNLVFSQAAADEMTKSLTTAYTAVGDLQATDPSSYDLGDPDVEAAAESVFAGLKLYTGNLYTGTGNINGLVSSASESIGTFDKNLAMLAAATPHKDGVEGPLKHGEEQDHRVQVTNPSSLAGTHQTTTHAHRDGTTTTDDHRTAHNPVSGNHTETTSHTHRDGQGNEISSTTNTDTTNHRDGTTSHTTVTHNEDGTSSTTHSTDTRHADGSGRETTTSTNTNDDGSSTGTRQSTTTNADGSTESRTDTITDDGRGRTTIHYGTPRPGSRRQ